MTTYKISGDTKQIIRDLGVVNKKIQLQVTNRALNNTVDKMYTRVVKGLSKGTGVAQFHFKGRKQSKSGAKVFRKAQKRMVHKYRSTFRTLNASVWMGFKRELNVSNVVKTAQGAYKFERFAKKTLSGKSAFTATMTSGHKGIYTRRSKARLKIDEVRLDFTAIGTRIIQTVGARMSRKEFKRQFIYEMKRQINRKGSRAFRR